MSAAGTVLVNTSFLAQRVTGQQRYATEIADRLLQRENFLPLGPRPRTAHSALRVWLWVLTRLGSEARGRVLVSLTSRAAPSYRHQVLIVHDLFVLTNPEWFSHKYVLSHAPVLRQQLRTAAAAVAVSEPVAEQLREYFAGPIVVAPNAPSSVFARADPEADRAVLATRKLRERSYLLAVGSMDPRKNLPALAAGYGLLDESTRLALPLVVVGGAASVYRDEQIAWPSGTVDAGYVTDDELRALYAGSRAVVFPSKAEGFGLPLVEAAAAGAGGLVVSDLPVFRWICRDGAVYVDPNSTESIAAGLRAAAASELPAISIEPGRFDWDRSAATVAELCLSLHETTKSIKR